jgi:hypothetical protein
MLFASAVQLKSLGGLLSSVLTLSVYTSLFVAVNAVFTVGSIWLAVWDVGICEYACVWLS